MVVWQDGSVGNIFSRRLTATGSATGATIQLAATSNSETKPDIAWSAAANAYLIVWQEGLGGTIAGQRVAASGSLLGNSLTVATGGYTPAITAVPDEWLVVWQKTDATADLYGQVVLRDGALSGAAVPMVTSSGSQTVPAVAGGEAAGQHLLVWQDGRSGNADVYSQLAQWQSEQLQTTTIVYNYDPLYRLTEAAYSGGISADYSYVYDAVGNMAAYTETVGATTTIVNRSFNAANQLVTSFDAGAGTSSYTYDNNGNLTRIQRPGTVPDYVNYVYNQRNLLTQTSLQSDTSSPTLQAEFVYDGDSNRLQQIDHSNSITTTYSNDVIGLAQVLLSDDGTTQTANLFGLDLIQQNDGSQTRTLLADGLGSARTEMVGSTVETTTTYEPYGRLLAQTGTSGTSYGYTGEQHDALTGLVYLRARYYNPALKIFMSKDPFPGYTTLAISQNGYAYVHANPVNLTDPSGEIVPLIVGGIIIGAVTGVTWDVMVVQGAGGLDNIRNHMVMQNLRCNVNWQRALMSGGAGAIIGGVGAPSIYALMHPMATYNAASSGIANTSRWLAARGTWAAYQSPRLVPGLQKAGK